MLRFVATTIGCKVNQYETRAAAGLLRRLGLAELQPAHSSPQDEPADLVVINTCCVTASAAAKSRRALRQAIRLHPGAEVLILGCYATQHAGALRRLARQACAPAGIHIAGHRNDVPHCIRLAVESLQGREASGSRPSGRPIIPCARATSKSSEHFRKLRSDGRGRAAAAPSQPAGPIRYEESIREGHPQRPAGPASLMACHYNSIKPHPCSNVKHNVGTAGLGPVRAFAGRQRALVKVQDGCDARCTYCIIPQLRRRVWSRPLGQILAEVRCLVANGHREVVLCGVFLGAYGQATAVRVNWPGPSCLPGLLRSVSTVPGLRRVRLSSLEAGDVTDELLAALADCPAAAPHLHLSLQSGSPAVLRRMNRHYGPQEFLEAVRRVRAALDRPAITTDVIVGFPGEGERDFQATLELARQAGFSRIHVFPFSARPGTPAWRWRKEAPDGRLVRRRCELLAALGRELAVAFRRQFLGQTVEVLVEQPNSKTPPGHCRGLTDRYVEVSFPAEGRPPAEWAGQIAAVSVTGLSETGLTGRIARSRPSAKAGPYSS